MRKFKEDMKTQPYILFSTDFKVKLFVRREKKLQRQLDLCVHLYLVEMRTKYQLKPITKDHCHYIEVLLCI